MPNFILKALLQKDLLSIFQYTAIQEWQKNAERPELNYYYKVADAFFANKDSKISSEQKLDDTDDNSDNKRDNGNYPESMDYQLI